MRGSNFRTHLSRREFLTLGAATATVVLSQACAPQAPAAKPGKKTTPDGWHIAARRGLPNRIITSVTMDPSNHRTVYVTLGASAARIFPVSRSGSDTMDPCHEARRCGFPPTTSGTPRALPATGRRGRST